MKKIMTIVGLCMLMMSIACAQTEPTEETYDDLATMRRKLVRMKREMDGFMKDIMATYPEQETALLADFGQDVKVDVVENAKDIVVRADLPGMDKDKIEVTLENDRVLKIAGTREVVKKDLSPGLVRQERSSGRFERVLELPAECMSEGIKATYKNGVLEVVIPKKTKAKEESVKINIQ